MEKPPDAAQLAALRAAFEQLGEIPLAELRNRLAKQPFFVGSAASLEDAEKLKRDLTSVGIGVELFTLRDYAAPYLRDVLQKPDLTWESAETTLEMVFRPAFSPEVILRLWATRGRSRLQLASMNASLWVTRFNPPSWLTSRARRVPSSSGAPWMETRIEPELPIENPTEETVTVENVEPFFEMVKNLPCAKQSLGLDGMFVDIEWRHGSRCETHALWSPSPERAPEAFALLRHVHSLAWESLGAPESRRRLEDLHCALDLGLPAERVGTERPLVVRLWGGLSIRHADALKDVLRELAGRRSVLDLSDVTSVAARLVDVLATAGPDLHFVVCDRHRPLLQSAGVAAAQLHESRADAHAATRLGGS